MRFRWNWKAGRSGEEEMGTGGGGARTRPSCGTANPRQRNRQILRLARTPGRSTPATRPPSPFQSIRQPPNLRAQSAEFFLDVLVAAVDVVDAVDDGVAFGDEAGQHQ